MLNREKESFPLRRGMPLLFDILLKDRVSAIRNWNKRDKYWERRNKSIFVENMIYVENPKLKHNLI
jgi:hypothetical protein